jgi:hypothetical protein
MIILMQLIMKRTLITKQVDHYNVHASLCIHLFFFQTEFRRELNRADLAHAKVEGLFYSALREVHSDGWGTRVCDLHDALLTSRDTLKLRRQQAKEWFCQERKGRNCGANDKELTQFFMSNINRKSETETRKGKKTGSTTEEVSKTCQQGSKGRKEGTGERHNQINGNATNS